MRTFQTFTLAICLAALASPTHALLPAEVLVVANSNVPESVELAEYYAQERGIPAENIVQVATSPDYGVHRVAYEREIRQPLLAALRARSDDAPIRCICLMWGMPVRVGAPRAKPNPMASFFSIEAERSHNALAIARELLMTVGRKFPQPAKPNSLALADLFEDLPPLPSTLLSLPKMQASALEMLASKTTQVRALADADKRAIAMRQLLALQYEINGLRGLVRFVEDQYKDTPNQAGLESYKKALAAAEEKLGALSQTPVTPENVDALLAAMKRFGGTLLVASHAAEQNQAINPPKWPASSGTASVDSELAMIWSDTTEFYGPAANPLFWRSQATGQNTPALLTARIDGPSAADARNIIDTSIVAEAAGLAGKFYVDAGLPTVLANKDSSGNFARFDEMLRGLGNAMLLNTDIEVVIDTKPEQFPPASAPQTGMYIGWYSLEEYVPAFTFEVGAVAYHVASFEAMDLRNLDSNQWCPKIIQNGAAATIGAVNEPFLHNFPEHGAFFLLLLTGEYTIAESYWRTIPAASWQMTLIADPLYTPFKANPRVPAQAVDRNIRPPENWPPVYQTTEVAPEEGADLENIFTAPDDAPSDE